MVGITIVLKDYNIQSSKENTNKWKILFHHAIKYEVFNLPFWANFYHMTGLSGGYDLLTDLQICNFFLHVIFWIYDIFLWAYLIVFENNICGELIFFGDLMFFGNLIFLVT